MSKAKYNIAPQYVRAEQTRQRYLDWFNANPSKTAAELGEYMAVTFDDARSTCNTTRQMIALGELRAVKSGRIWKYFATATQTTSALSFSIKQRTAAKNRMDRIHGNELSQLKTAKETWRYVHKPGEYGVPGHKQGHPLKNQEAIGSGRSRVYVGCVGMGASLGL